MNTDKFKIIIIILFINSFSWANPINGKYKKTKIVQKTFNIETGSSIHIDNSYGNVSIATWNKNVANIKVTIEVSGNYNDDVIKRINDINVKIYQKNGDIYGVTNPGNTSYSYSWSLFSLFSSKKNHNISFKINYDIKMPENNNLFIKNKYGNIFIDVLSGNLSLNADYGKFDIGELNGENNKINIDYFSHSEIDFIKNGIIKADYSKINIENAYNLKIIADYTNMAIDKIRKINFSNDYGSIKINDAMQVTGKGDYQTRYFGNVNKVDFHGDYGSIKIENIKPSFDSIILNCDYTNVKIINENNANYKLNLSQNYGCFKYNNLNVSKDIQDNSDRSIEAYYGNKNAKSTIRINMDYGCLKLYNN